MKEELVGTIIIITTPFSTQTLTDGKHTLNANKCLSNQFKDVFVLSEWHMYGSSRLGIQKPVSKDSHAELVSASQFSASAGTGRELVHVEFSGSWSSYEVNYADTSNTTVSTYQMSYEYYSLTRGEKNYEMVNHLGNVLVVISDKKLKTCTGDTVNYYTADVLQANDYSAFGVILKGREYYADTTGKYRMGFNGKLIDNETYGDGNEYDYGFRIYSPRLGKFLSVDPLTNKYAFYSPYHFAGNKPIVAVDLDGREDVWVHFLLNKKGEVISVTTNEDVGEIVRGWLETVFKVPMPKKGTLYTVQVEGSNMIRIFKYTPSITCKPKWTFESFIKNGDLPFDFDETLNEQFNEMYANDEKAIGFIDGAGEVAQDIGVVTTVFAPPLGSAIYAFGAVVKNGASLMKAGTAILDRDYKKATIEGGAVLVGAVAGAATDKIKDKVRGLGVQVMTDKLIDDRKKKLEGD